MCMETRSQAVRPRWRYLLLILAHFPGIVNTVAQRRWRNKEFSFS